MKTGAYLVFGAAVARSVTLHVEAPFAKESST